MAIDRTARERIADALASYLRGEADLHETRQRCRPGPWHDETALWADFEIGDVHHDRVASLPVKDREWLRRVLAFLCSDLEIHQSIVRRRWPTAHTFWALATLGLLVFAGYLANTYGWWIFAVAWVIVAPVWHHAHDRNLARRVAQAEPPWEFAPFPDRATWEANEPHLARFHLPSNDPATTSVLSRPKPNAWLSALERPLKPLINYTIFAAGAILLWGLGPDSETEGTITRAGEVIGQNRTEAETSDA